MIICDKLLRSLPVCQSPVAVRISEAIVENSRQFPDTKFPNDLVKIHASSFVECGGDKNYR